MSEPVVTRRGKHAGDDLQAYMHVLGNNLAVLGPRVFALRGTGYYGSGFHWNLERSLGKLILAANDYENPDYWHGANAGMVRMSMEIGYEMLVKSVEQAEESLRLIPEMGLDAYTDFVRKREAAYMKVEPQEQGSV